MRFRPSIYSQVQLTSYAPNGGYPGFYGDAPFSAEGETPLVGMPYDTPEGTFTFRPDGSVDAQVGGSSTTYAAGSSKAKNALKATIASASAGSSSSNNIWSQLAGRVIDVGSEWIGSRSSQGGSTSSSGSSAGGTTLSIPTNLTASEKALIEACKKKPLTQRAVCLAKAVQTINAQRAQAASGGGGGGKGGKAKGSSTLLWVIGGVVVVGGVAAVLYTRKRS